MITLTNFIDEDAMCTKKTILKKLKYSFYKNYSLENAKFYIFILFGKINKNWLNNKFNLI